LTRNLQILQNFKKRGYVNVREVFKFLIDSNHRNLKSYQNIPKKSFKINTLYYVGVRLDIFVNIGYFYIISSSCVLSIYYDDKWHFYLKRKSLLQLTFLYGQQELFLKFKSIELALQLKQQYG
jgi:hypothetical protein